MKNSLFLPALAIALAVVSGGFTAPAKMARVTVTSVYKNIEEGYDHICKNEVWIDDDRKNAVWSNQALESKKIEVTLEVPKGKHTIHVMNHALYEGTWEEHIIDNNYSIDSQVSTEATFKKKHKLDVVFDLDKGVTYKFK